MSKSSSVDPAADTLSERGPARQTDARRRRKVALACEACRLRKIKCDGVIPICGTCRRRQSPPDRCLYHNDNARTAVTKEYLNGLLDRIRNLERAHQAEGGTPEFQDQESSLHAHGEQHHQRHASGDYQEATHVAPMDGVQNSPPLLITTGNLERPQDQPTLDQEMYLQNGQGLEDGPSRQTYPPVASSAAGPPYLTSQSDPGDDRSMPMMQAHQAQSPSLSVGSHSVKLRQDSTERDNPINAMGAASSITDGGLESSDHFYGTSSVVSFSQQIYQTQQRLNGGSNSILSQVSTTTAAQPTRDMLSELLTSIPIPKPDDYFLPPRVLADHLLNCYWSRVHCLYPFVHQQSFMATYGRLWGTDTQETLQEPIAKVGLGGSGCSVSVYHCALNAIFALGCQFSDLPLAQRENLSETFFRRSKQLLRIDVLDEGDLALIQTLLIVAQFLQSTQFPNRCWNVVGLACRMAQGLGLYLDGANESRPFVEVEMRRRTWYGCVTLDLVLSMTLGRPMSLSDAWPVHLPRAIDDKYMDSTSLICQQPPDVFSCTTFYICTIKLYKILGSILTSVYNLYPALGGSKTSQEQNESSPLDTLVKMDCALSNFESNIPPQLHWKPKGDVEKSLVSQRQSNVLHARFLHLKIVLYRPIFTQLCRKAFPGSLPVNGRKSTSEYKQDCEDNPLYSSFSRQCSITCIQSAQELIELISVTSQTAATGAWWYNVFYLFTSAMVIILAELCPTVFSNLAPDALDASWQKCQQTLKLMSSYNVAAQKCAETLSAMRQRAAPPTLNEQEINPEPSEPPGFQMQIGPALPEESRGYSEQPDHVGNFRSGARSPANGIAHDSSQFDDAQLWDVLWHDTGSVPTWNIEEWGWGNEGMIE